MVTVIARVLDGCDAEDELALYGGDPKKNPGLQDLLAEIQEKAGIPKPVVRLFTISWEPILTVAGAVSSRDVIATCSGEAGKPIRGSPPALAKAVPRAHARKLRNDPWAASLPTEAFNPPKPPMRKVKMQRTAAACNAKMTEIALPRTILKPPLASTVLDRISKHLGESVDALFDAKTGYAISDPAQLEHKMHVLYACSGDPWPVKRKRGSSLLH